jgi:hypothetical protein
VNDPVAGDELRQLLNPKVGVAARVARFASKGVSRGFDSPKIVVGIN